MAKQAIGSTQQIGRRAMRLGGKFRCHQERNLFCLFRGIRKSHHRLVVKSSGGPNLSSHEITPCRNENSSIGPMTQIAEFLRNAEQQIYDFNTPWSMAIVVLGFLSAWAVTDLLERLGLTRHVWHLPLFFAALAVLFGSLIGLFFAP